MIPEAKASVLPLILGTIARLSVIHPSGAFKAETVGLPLPSESGHKVRYGSFNRIGGPVDYADGMITPVADIDFVSQWIHYNRGRAQPIFGKAVALAPQRIRSSEELRNKLNPDETYRRISFLIVDIAMFASSCPTSIWYPG